MIRSPFPIIPRIFYTLIYREIYIREGKHIYFLSRIYIKYVERERIWGTIYKLNILLLRINAKKLNGGK